ncbi:hypothetical protein DM02DRAFT_618153 [Periconia macrospinosa]|uniref:Uncharacterized protein n=1 Tax=Periconia macrospinosa TaxID=97972 RepID=A0A2V1DAI6_9PLEO|nr:hypothetical protein DM02DRAFT_618153 [Periconia macrospinosa]
MRKGSQQAGPMIDVSSLWLHVALTIDYAIEFPLFLAYHPSTLLHARDVFGCGTLPGKSQQALQAGVLFLIECFLEKFILILILDPWHRCKDKEDMVAARLVLDFVRPRATLLIAVWILSGSGAHDHEGLTATVGPVHVASMAWWVVLQQAVF